MADVRPFTEHERTLLNPFVHAVNEASANLRVAIALLAGEAHKGWSLAPDGSGLVPPERPEA